MLKQKFLIQFGSNFILKIVGMIAGVVVARVAGPEVVGIIAFGTAYVGVFGFITGLFGTGHIKAISEGKDLGKCISTYTLLQGSSIALYSIVVMGWFLFHKFVLNYEFESREQQIVIPILLVAHVASLILDFGNSTFTARLEQAKANYAVFIKSIIWHIGRVVLVVLGFRAVGLASWNMIITILAIPLAWRFLKRLPWGGFSKELAKKYWLIALPVFLIVIINSLIAYSDKLILAHFTSVEELGYYSAAFAIGGIFLLISRAVGMIFFPLFSELISKKQWDIVNKKIQTFLNFVTLFIFPSLCAMAIIGKPLLLYVLGIKYQPSVNPFIVLLFATYVEIIGMPYGNVITGMGKFNLVVLLNFFKLIVFVVCIIYFVSPNYLGLGAIGLALNLFIVNIFMNVLFYVFAFHFGKMKLDVLNIKRHGITIILALCVYSIINVYKINQEYWWILTGILFIAISYLLLFVFRFINSNDINHLINLLKIKNTHQYIKEEFRV